MFTQFTGEVFFSKVMAQALSAVNAVSRRDGFYFRQPAL